MFVAYMLNPSKYTAPANPVLEPSIAPSTSPVAAPFHGARFVTENFLHVPSAMALVNGSVCTTDTAVVPLW